MIIGVTRSRSPTADELYRSLSNDVTSPNWYVTVELPKVGVLPRPRSPRLTTTFETEAQAKDFARAKLREGQIVFAGTINLLFRDSLSPLTMLQLGSPTNRNNSVGPLSAGEHLGGAGLFRAAQQGSPHPIIALALVERSPPIRKTVLSAPPTMHCFLAKFASEATDSARFPSLLRAVDRPAIQATEIDAECSSVWHSIPRAQINPK